MLIAINDLYKQLIRDLSIKLDPDERVPKAMKRLKNDHPWVDKLDQIGYETSSGKINVAPGLPTDNRPEALRHAVKEQEMIVRMMMDKGGERFAPALEVLKYHKPIVMLFDKFQEPSERARNIQREEIEDFVKQYRNHLENVESTFFTLTEDNVE